MRYLLNNWYVAAFDHEVGGLPLARVILGHKIVLFRDEMSTPVALMDRCPHRLVPLSRGSVINGQIECGYHGLCFDRTGSCVANPHGDGAIPPAIRVRSFPVTERYGFVWLWSGDPVLADSKLIPEDFAFLDSAEYAVVRGYLNIKANYLLVVDNLLDLGHVPFVHPQFGIAGVPARDRIRQLTVDVERVGDTVWSRRVRPNVPPGDQDRKLFGITAERINFRAHMHWLRPSNLYFDRGSTECTSEAKDYAFPAAHLVTPEAGLSSHYFFAQARNVALKDAAISADQLASMIYAFKEQDQPMIEAQQVALGASDDLTAARPMLFGIDKAPVLARRILQELIENEAEYSSSVG
jgi:phenylpropionate dioxygenase-like ring-hydroxylating dioxygenase large terminal subunit